MLGGLRFPYAAVERNSGFPEVGNGRRERSPRSTGPRRNLGGDARKGGSGFDPANGSGAAVPAILAGLKPMGSYGTEHPLPNLRLLLRSPDLLRAAYDRLKSKPGNATPGANGQTLSGLTDG